MSSSTPTPTIQMVDGLYWRGDFITSLGENQIFVFGSNPEGRHGAGAAKQVLQF